MALRPTCMCRCYQILNVHRLQDELQRSLISFAPHPFVPRRQSAASMSPSPLFFQVTSLDFTRPSPIPHTSPPLQCCWSLRLPHLSPMVFSSVSSPPSTNPLCLFLTNNVRFRCMTASAGTIIRRNCPTATILPFHCPTTFTTFAVIGICCGWFRLAPIDQYSRLLPSLKSGSSFISYGTDESSNSAINHQLVVPLPLQLL